MARRKILWRVLLILSALAFTGFWISHAAEISPGNKLPPGYVVRGNCVPNMGYHAGHKDAERGKIHRMVVLNVFNGEVIGFETEQDAQEGWRPWFDQPEGKAITHEGMEHFPHYTQHIFIKKPPTAEQCKASKGPGF